MLSCVRFVAVAALFLTWSAQADGQSISNHPRVIEAANLLDLWLGAQRDYDDIPGISAGVVSGQDLIWSNGYGFANVANQIPATAATM